MCNSIAVTVQFWGSFPTISIFLKIMIFQINGLFKKLKYNINTYPAGLAATQRLTLLTIHRHRLEK